jgi:arylformamidase
MQGALLLGAASASVAMAQPVMQHHVPPGLKPGPKGPRVFMDYDQQELDWAYDQAPWAPNTAEIFKRNAQQSAAALARLGPPLQLSYGTKEIEKIEVYRTRQPKAPIHVFIHGGAWRTGSARAAAYMAENYVDAGAVFVAVDFNNVGEVDGSLLVMADQVRRAVAWIKRNASTFGGDPDRIYVSGTSSGAHLAGVVLTTAWESSFGLPADTVKGGLLCSGMYELTPVSLSARASYVKFTPETIDQLSAQRHLNHLNAPLVVAYGTLETPEFQRQNRDFVAALQTARKPVTLLVGQGYNHFEMFETLASPYGLLGRAMLNLMKLRPT